MSNKDTSGWFAKMYSSENDGES